jgi:hypothetical protein
VVDVSRNVGLGVAVEVDVSFGLAVGSGDVVAATVVAAVGARLDAAVGWSTSRWVAESMAEALARLPKDADKHKAYNQACGCC